MVGWRFSSPNLGIFRVVIEEVRKLATPDMPSMGVLKKSILHRKRRGSLANPPPLKLNIPGVVIEVARKLVRSGLPMSHLLKPPLLRWQSMGCCRVAISPAQIDHYLIRN